MVLQSAKLSLTRDRSSVTHVGKKATKVQIVPGLTGHRSLAMVDTENLATIMRTRTIREKINSHAISLAGAIINSHTTKMGINHTTAAERENLVTKTDHRGMMMVIRDLAAIIREIEIVSSAENMDIGNMSVQISQM